MKRPSCKMEYHFFCRLSDFRFDIVVRVRTYDKKSSCRRQDGVRVSRCEPGVVLRRQFSRQVYVYIEDDEKELETEMVLFREAYERIDLG